MSWFNDEFPSLLSKLLSGNVGTHTASPLCSLQSKRSSLLFVSNRAEPTNYERNLSAPVVVYYGWMGLSGRDNFFLSIPWQKKAKRAAAMLATALCSLEFNCRCDISCWGATIYQQKREHVMRHLLCTNMKKKDIHLVLLLFYAM